MIESLKDVIKDTQSDTIEWVHTATEIVEATDFVMAVITATAVTSATGEAVTALIEGIEGAAGGFAWPVTVAAAAVVGELAAIGAGYEEAANKIAAQNAATGFSQGVVMGVMQAATDFVKSNFVKWAPDQNDFFPEAGALAQHYYNASLVLGLKEGRELDAPSQAMFWRDMLRDGKGPIDNPGDDSNEQGWIDFYIAAAARFELAHITDTD